MSNESIIQTVITAVIAIMGVFLSTRKKEVEQKNLKVKNLSQNKNIILDEVASEVVIQGAYKDLMKDDKGLSETDRQGDFNETEDKSGLADEKESDIIEQNFDSELIKAIVYSEILSPPKAYRGFRRGIH